MDALFNGVIWGLILCISIGPVFFLLIQTSIKDGLSAALIMDIGIVGSDIFCLWLAYVGTSSIFQNPSYQLLFGLIGGVILIGFGLVPFLRKPKANSKSDEFEIPPKDSYFRLILKGFLMNTTNPFVFLFWIGYVGVASFNKWENAQLWVFFVSTFLVVILTDFLKAYLAHRIKSRLTEKMLLNINKVSGAGIILFGIILIIRVIYS